MSPPDPGLGSTKLGAGSIVIVYVPRACTKKNLESISPMILILGHIFLVFGQFGFFGSFLAIFNPLQYLTLSLGSPY